MLELDFVVEGIEPARFAAAPTLNFAVQICQGNAPPLAIHSIQLQCQLRIECVRRGYTASEQGKLRDLFGAPERWRHTLHSMLWTHVTKVIPAFDTARTTVTLPVPSSYDFTVAATKYFDGLEGGSVPLSLLFSGSVFYRDARGALAVEPISWNCEQSVDLPVTTWRELMNRYYPDTVWLQLQRDCFERLHHYKRAGGYVDFDRALDALLEQCPAITPVSQTLSGEESM